MFDGKFKVIFSSRRRRVGFRVDDTGLLEVHAPAGITEAQIRRVIADNLPVVERAFREFSGRIPPIRRRYTEGEHFPFAGRELPLVFTRRLLLANEDALFVPRDTPEKVRENLERLYRCHARKVLQEKCFSYGSSRGLLPASVGITGAVTRWGSCSSRKHISFCWKIMLLPEELMDYVVCHELAHLRHLDHSKEFWQLVSELCPAALIRRKKLREMPELWPLPHYGG